MTWAPSVLVILFVLTLPSARPEAVAQVDFATPAQAHGDAELGGVEWALLIFTPDARSSFQWQLAAEAIVNRTFVYSEVHYPNLSNSTHGGELPEHRQTLQAHLEGNLRFGGSWSSLYVEATDIDLRIPDADVGLRRTERHPYAAAYLPPSPQEPGAFRIDLSVPRGIAFSFAPNASAPLLDVGIEAQGVRRMEWHNADMACEGPAACRDGAREARQGAWTAGKWSGYRTLPYLQLDGSDGRLTGSGRAFVMAAGGHRADAVIDGWMRFPDAVVSGCRGASCPSGGQTLQVEGRTSLWGLAANGDGERVTAGFGSEVRAARVDEEPAAFLPASAWTGAAVAGGLLALLGKVLAALFARKTRPLLEHPRTKALLDLVVARPGLSFRGLVQETGWGYGTVQYHAKRLLAAGLVVARRHRNTVRYFENHGRHEHDWQAHAALHNPHLRHLLAWIKANPGATQATLMAAVAEWGWKRRTTRDHLDQLEQAGIIQATHTPARTRYHALQ